MTDSARLATQLPGDLLSRIKIVMVNTTLPANIGAAARAMKTMGLSQLVLVAPKLFPHGDATALASGAAGILTQAQVVDTLQDAIADCQLVLATSARQRSMPWPIQEARAATGQAMDEACLGNTIAIVFGREDRGLTNEELALANCHVMIPTDSEYGVLNVAAAIQVLCYELRMHALDRGQPTVKADQAKYFMASDAQSAIDQAELDEPWVEQAAMEQFYPEFERTLAAIDFMDPANPRLLPLRLRRLFGRTRLDRMEYNLLRGMLNRVQAIVEGRWPPDSLRSKKP